MIPDATWRQCRDVIIRFITQGMKHGRGMKSLIDFRDLGGSNDYMDTRPPSAEITSSLTTIADKIRALAHADYDRSEISKILGIRYQQVRNVMLRSGLVGGLRREVEAEREPVEVDAAPAPREDTSWKILTDAGFQLIGEWTQDPESLDPARRQSAGAARRLLLHRGRCRCLCRFDLERVENAVRSIPPRPQGPEDQFPHQRTDLRNTVCGKESQSARRDARALGVAGTTGQHGGGTGSGTH